MRKIVIFLLIVAIFFCNSFAYAAIKPVNNKPVWKAQIFITNQVKGIGLVDSYQEDNNDYSYTYDNALAAIASMVSGNFGVAKEILDTLCFEVQNSPEGVPFGRYFYNDVNGSGNIDAYCGNIAWLLQALDIYQKQTGDKAYFAVQKKLADFLLTLQDTDGGLRGKTGVLWKSAEGNIIAYAAIRNFGSLNGLSIYTAKAENIKTFLKSQVVWNGTYFNQGPNDNTRIIDVQALGVLLLGNSYAGALNWAEKYLKCTKPFGVSSVTGFDFDDNLDTVWLEGTLQAALAFYASKNTTKGNYYFGQSDRTIQSDGSLLWVTNNGTVGGEIVLPWRAVAPTCWYIFYSYKFNPLILY